MIERFLFGFTRFIALIVAIASLAAIAASAFLLMHGFRSPTFVSYEDVAAQMQPAGQYAAHAGNVAHAPAPYSIPENLKALFSGDNAKVLQGWLDTLEDDAQKQDFLDNLSQVVAEAQQKGGDETKVINNYKDIKLKRLVQSPFEKYVTMGEQAAAVGSIIALIFLLILTSLVLVLLAIERHTRHSIQTGQKPIE